MVWVWVRVRVSISISISIVLVLVLALVLALVLVFEVGLGLRLGLRLRLMRNRSVGDNNGGACAATAINVVFHYPLLLNRTSFYPSPLEGLRVSRTLSKTLRHFLTPGGEKEPASFWSGKCWADKAKPAKEFGYCSEKGVCTTGNGCLFFTHPAFSLNALIAG